MGVLFQCNYGSILGNYGLAAKFTLKRMLKEELVSFLGSDVHRESTIYKQIPKAIKKLTKFISEEYLEDLTSNNAEIILNGENL